MQILNNYQINSTAFTGQIITKGPWPENLRKAFENSPKVKELADGASDVVAHIKKYVVSDREGFNNRDHSPGEKLYRISISFVDNNWYSRLADTLKIIPRIKLTSNYHRENSMIKLLDSAIQNKFLSRYFESNHPNH